MDRDDDMEPVDDGDLDNGGGHQEEGQEDDVDGWEVDTDVDVDMKWEDDITQLDVTGASPSVMSGGSRQSDALKEDGDEDLQEIPTHRRIVRTFTRYRNTSLALFFLMLYTVTLSLWTLQVLIVTALGTYYIITKNLVCPLVLFSRYPITMTGQFLALSTILLPLFYASDPPFTLVVIMFTSTLYIHESSRTFLYNFCVELFIGIDATSSAASEENQSAASKQDWRVLVNLRLLTPQEVYDEKLEKEDYTVALEVAEECGLDKNILYERIWKRTTPITLGTIENSLAKVTNRLWVVKETINEVPEDISVAKELLKFGIEQTSLRHILTLRYDDDDTDESESGKDTDPLIGRSGQMRNHKMTFPETDEEEAEFLKTFDWSSLSLEQKQLCFWRLKLLKYSDRLVTYESILGGEDVAAKFFSTEFFAKFRDQSALEVAIEFARAANSRAVAAMFSYAPYETLPHWLAILENFPDTTHPLEYRILLPVCGLFEDEPDVASWNTVPIRKEADWSERYRDHYLPSSSAQRISDRNGDDDEYTREFYQTYPDLKYFRAKEVEGLSKQLVTDWITRRARVIEAGTRLLTNALTLVQLALECNTPGLDRLHDEMTSFATLVYECDPDLVPQIEEMTLDEYERLSTHDRMELMMSGLVRREDQLIPAIHNHLIPFLQRADKHHNQDPSKSLVQEMLHVYLLSLARRDLSYCLRVFDNSKVVDETTEDDQKSSKAARPLLATQKRIIRDPKVLMRFALDCLYASERTDQIEICYAIYACLPAREDDEDEVSKAKTHSSHSTTSHRKNTSDLVVDPVMEALHDECDVLEQHLNTLELLRAHDHAMTLHGLRDLQQGTDRQPDILNLFNQLLREPLKRAASAASTFKQNEWLELISDLQAIRTNCFSSSVSEDQLYEMFTETLLGSGRREYFPLAASFMQLDPRVPLPRRKKLIPHEEAIRIIIGVARNYVNSCRSSQDSDMELVERDLFDLFSHAEHSHHDIVSEREFIETVRLLNEDFGLPLFPIQIRLMETERAREDLLDQALNSSLKAYKKTSKFRRLVACLLGGRGSQSEETCDCQALNMLVNQSILARDWPHAWTLCKIIMTSNYRTGWTACERLAAIEDFQDLEARRQLITFAMGHCDDPTGEKLVSLIQSSASLRAALLRRSLAREVSAKPHEMLQVAIDPLKSAATTTARRVTSLLQTAIGQLPLDMIKGQEDDNQRPQEKSEMKEPPPSSGDQQESERIMAVPAFYSDLYPDYKPSDLTCKYEGLRQSSTSSDGDTAKAHLIQLLLRLQFLGGRSTKVTSSTGEDVENSETAQKEATSEASRLEAIHSLLREGALALRYEDTPLAVAYQLASSSSSSEKDLLNLLDLKLGER